MMGVKLKHEYKEKYFVMSNSPMQDKNLSNQAKGLLAIMMSLPEDWDYSEAGLTAICKDGRTAIRTSLKELEDNGYLIRKVDRDDKGRVSGGTYTFSDYKIVDSPQSDFQTMDNVMLENEHNKVHTNEVHTNEVHTLPKGRKQLFTYIEELTYKKEIKEILTIWLREVGLTKIKGLSVNTLKKKVEEVITEVGEDNAYKVFEYSVMGGYPNFYTDRVKKNSRTKNNDSVPVNSTFMTNEEFYEAKEFI